MKVTVVGLGPGAGRDLTGRARETLERADLIIGYTAYIALIREAFPEKEMRSTGMRREVDRCREAVEAAVSGKDVAMVCSGDSGIYGMAGLVYEVAQEYPPIDIEVVPGITAACGGAAVLGAPLTHDFAVVSLSDLLTPWDLIEKRLRCAAGRPPRPSAAMCGTSAGRGRPPSSPPWRSWGRSRWTCSPPSLWAAAAPRSSAGRW